MVGKEKCAYLFGRLLSRSLDQWPAAAYKYQIKSALINHPDKWYAAARKPPMAGVTPEGLFVYGCVRTGSMVPNAYFSITLRTYAHR